MAHLEGEAAGAEVVETVTDNQGGEDTQTNENTDAQNLYPDELDEGEPDGDPELGEGEDDDDADDEPEEDIVAPVGLKADEKERFEQLPKEAQRALSEIIQRKDRDAQKGVESALTAQRDAERSAADRIAETQRDFAEQSARLIQAFAPQPPPPELAQADPGRYIAEKALYDQELAGFNQLLGQLGEVHGQASQHFNGRDQEWAQEQVKQLMSIPEFADEATRLPFTQELQTIGVELGYGDDALKQADAKDFFALNKARAWKQKADKWDAHQKKRNERPREARGGRFAAAPAGGRVTAQPGQTDTLKALYPND